MMGRGSGTGQPYWFMCSRRRRERVWPNDYPDGHDVVRTGRVRGNPHSAGGYGRKLHGGTVEYRCSCGHVGWTNHVDVLRVPLACTCMKADDGRVEVPSGSCPEHGHLVEEHADG